MKVVAVVQVRLGSVRFPRKVLQPVNGVPLIELLLGRLARAQRVDEIVVATPETELSQELAELVRGLGYGVYGGSEHDVLDRYYQAARLACAGAVVRVTGDCPLIDPELVDDVIREFEESGADEVSNNYPPTYPDGLDVEVFSFAALERAAREADTPFQREHVSPFIRESGYFMLRTVRNDTDLSDVRWTVDEPADLEVVRAVFEHFYPRTDFGWREVLQLSREQPQLFTANRHIGRDEGSAINVGQKLWRRARRVIPGGSMLLSKRPEMFLPELWPTYFSRARGCRVWDLEGNELVDMSLMGVGTNILGYGHPEVDNAVRSAVDAGNLSTLNCPEEVELAERLVELHPWADMVRFARSGGEANAVAIRVARAASGREKVAFCGYHGWHDWYLAANLGSGDGLAGHLLKGLQPGGVPEELQGTALPFGYNRFNELQALVEQHEIGVIKMEVSRNEQPRDGFLEKVRQLASERGIVLIFDECTSGFRQALGGLHKFYGVEPDMAVFGKALGNGYAITATIGRREIMEAAQDTFISSTFWTERIGPVAALKTLEIMERTGSWETITKTGRAIERCWRELAARHGLPITCFGLPAMRSFVLGSGDPLAYKTLISQEMLASGYLAGNTVYTSTEHTPEVIEGYIEALDPVFGLIRQCEDGRDVNNLLLGPVCHGGFQRLS